MSVVIQNVLFFKTHSTQYCDRNGSVKIGSYIGDALGVPVGYIMIADVTLVKTRVIILNFLRKDWLRT